MITVPNRTGGSPRVDALRESTFIRNGPAQVTYIPGHPGAEVAAALPGRAITGTADEMRRLAYAMLDALDGELADTRLVAHRVAHLSDVASLPERRAA